METAAFTISWTSTSLHFTYAGYGLCFSSPPGNEKLCWVFLPNGIFLTVQALDHCFDSYQVNRNDDIIQKRFL